MVRVRVRVHFDCAEVTPFTDFFLVLHLWGKKYQKISVLFSKRIKLN